MDASERELMKRWVDTWKQAGPELEQVWREDVLRTDTVRDLALLESAFNHALQRPARESSGLVEMQRYFAMLRK